LQQQLSPTNDTTTNKREHLPPSTTDTTKRHPSKQETKQYGFSLSLSRDI